MSVSAQLTLASGTEPGGLEPASHLHEVQQSVSHSRQKSGLVSFFQKKSRSRVHTHRASKTQRAFPGEDFPGASKGQILASALSGAARSVGNSSPEKVKRRTVSRRPVKTLQRRAGEFTRNLHVISLSRQPVMTGDMLVQSAEYLSSLASPGYTGPLFQSSLDGQFLGYECFVSFIHIKEFSDLDFSGSSLIDSSSSIDKVFFYSAPHTGFAMETRPRYLWAQASRLRLQKMLGHFHLLEQAPLSLSGLMALEMERRDARSSRPGPNRREGDTAADAKNYSLAQRHEGRGKTLEGVALVDYMASGSAEFGAIFSGRMQGIFPGLFHGTLFFPLVS